MCSNAQSEKRQNSYYGVRRRVGSDVHGKPIYDETALSFADFLNPTDDDFFEVGPCHDRDVAHLFRALQVHHRHNGLIFVQRDLKVEWRDKEIAQPRPDVLVAARDVSQETQNKRYSVVDWGAPPRCIIEVTAPRLAGADLVDKVEIYARGGVNEYIIVDSGLRDEQQQTNYRVIGYQLIEGRYRAIEPDAQGQVVSRVNRIKIGPTHSGRDFRLVDLRTNQVIRGEDVVEQDRVAQVQGNRRAGEIGSALDFLRG